MNNVDFLKFKQSFRIVQYLLFISVIPEISKIFILTNIQVNVKRFAVAIPIRRKNVLMEGAIHTNR